MAGYGTEAGVGVGIGSALQSIGEGWKGYIDRQTAERDKTADKMEKELQDTAYNLVQKLGGRSFTQAMAQPGDDHAELAGLYNQLSQGVARYNGLFPPHETSKLIARIQRLGGKQPTAPTADPRATTIERQLAQASRAPLAKGQQTLAQQYDEITGIMKRLHPGETDEQIQARVEPIMFAQKAGAAAEKYYVDPKGQKPGRWVNVRDAQDVSDAETEGLVAQAPGASGGAAKLGTLNGYLQIKFQGKTPTAAEILAAKKEWLSAVPAKTVAVGSFGDFLNHLYPQGYTAQQMQQAQQEWTTSEREGQVIHDNGDGTATVYTLTSTTRKGVVPQGPATPTAPPVTAPNVPSVVPAPGGAGATVAPPVQPKTAPAGRLTPGQTIPGKRTPEYSDAAKKFEGAKNLYDFALKAQQSKNPSEQRLLAGRLVRESEGRFNPAQFDGLVKTAGLANTFEQWMNNLTTGRLTDTIMTYLVAAAKDNMDAAKTTMDSMGPKKSQDDEDLTKRLRDAIK